MGFMKFIWYLGKAMILRQRIFLQLDRLDINFETFPYDYIEPLLDWSKEEFTKRVWVPKWDQHVHTTEAICQALEAAPDNSTKDEIIEVCKEKLRIMYAEMVTTQNEEEYHV